MEYFEDISFTKNLSKLLLELDEKNDKEDEQALDLDSLSLEKNLSSEQYFKNDSFYEKKETKKLERQIKMIDINLDENKKKHTSNIALIKKENEKLKKMKNTNNNFSNQNNGLINYFPSSFKSYPPFIQRTNCTNAVSNVNFYQNYTCNNNYLQQMNLHHNLVINNNFNSNSNFLNWMYHSNYNQMPINNYTNNTNQMPINNYTNNTNQIQFLNTESYNLFNNNIQINNNEKYSNKTSPSFSNKINEKAKMKNTKGSPLKITRRNLNRNQVKETINKNSKIELQELKNIEDLVEVFKNRNYNQTLKDNIHKLKSKINETIFPNIKKEILPLMKHKFANYIVYEMIQFLTETNIDYVFSLVSLYY